MSAAEGRLAERDRHLADAGSAPSRWNSGCSRTRMTHVQVAARRRRVAGLALAVEADAVMPLSTPAGMLTGTSRLTLTRPCAVAVGAGVGDDGAAAAAAGAGLLQCGRSPATCDDRRPGRRSAGTSPGCVPRLRPAAGAVVAGLLARDGDRLRDAAGRLDEVDLDGHSAGRGRRLRAAPPAAAAEQVAEQMRRTGPKTESALSKSGSSTPSRPAWP